MNTREFFVLAVFAATLALAQMAAVAQTSSDGEIAKVFVGANGIKWEMSVANAGGTLTVTFPDTRAFRKTFRAGATVEISLSETQLHGLPDGTYTWELRLAPELSSVQKEALLRARGRDDDDENERMGRKRAVVPVLSQTGSFAIVSGAIIGPGRAENQRATAKAAEVRNPVTANTVARLRNHRVSMGIAPDQVIPDDLIVQGSACVGLDCVNGEVFGFDTIRLKENNTRLQFDDTSTSAGFPTNNWQIRANSSGSGGESFLGFVDQGATGNSESGTVVFQVNAGAPANSLKVSSTGKVGFRTGTPIMDLHMNTSDTPAVRFEQNNGGGFTAQTWDVAGNEANFFVRDVTGGSRLPLRIRPGAPTSSLDISASGNIGIGTASPSFKMSLSTDATGADPAMLELRGATNANRHLLLGYETTANYGYIAAGETGVGFKALALNPNGGNVGVGTNAPTDLLSVNGNASKPGGGSWAVFSDERLKNIRGYYNRGLRALMQLQPLRYEYKPDNALGLKSEGERIGFGAQTLQQIIPEAVTKNSAGYLMVNNDPILWTMLNAIKEQQKEIEQLKGQIRKLQTSARRNRK